MKKIFILKIITILIYVGFILNPFILWFDGKNKSLYDIALLGLEQNKESIIFSIIFFLFLIFPFIYFINIFIKKIYINIIRYITIFGSIAFYFVLIDEAFKISGKNNDYLSELNEFSIPLFILIGIVAMEFIRITIKYLFIEDENDKNDKKNNVDNDYNSYPPYDNKIELSEEDKVYLKEQQIELELLKQKQELEAIKKQQELDEKIDKLKKILKFIFNKLILVTKNLFKKYKPIVIEKSGEISSKINEKIKETDFEGLKNKSLETIKKSNKINKKYIYIILSIILISIFTFIGNKLYEIYFYNNQIIKTDEKIFLRKDPDFIEFFNNNKIKIIPENKEHLLSQMLYSYRQYNENYNSGYKYAGYSVLKLNINLPSPLPEGFHYSSSNNDDIDLDKFTKNIGNNNLLEIQSESEKNVDIYKTELFKNLNNFTNKNTFYSNIELIKNGVFDRFPGNFKNTILDIFGIKTICYEIDKVNPYIIFSGNRLLGLDYKNNNLILRLEYSIKQNSPDIESIKKIIDEIDNYIYESSPIIFNDYRISKNDEKLFIEIIFKLNYEKIKNNDAINNLPLFYNY